MFPALLQVFLAAGKQAIISALPAIVDFIKKNVDIPLLGRTLVMGELADPGFVGPLKAVLAASDKIFIDAQLRDVAVKGIAGLIGLFASSKALHLAAVESGAEAGGPDAVSCAASVA